MFFFHLSSNNVTPSCNKLPVIVNSSQSWISSYERFYISFFFRKLKHGSFWTTRCKFASDRSWREWQQVILIMCSSIDAQIHNTRLNNYRKVEVCVERIRPGLYCIHSQWEKPQCKTRSTEDLRPNDDSIAGTKKSDEMPFCTPVDTTVVQSELQKSKTFG